jgi:hypothetical protein
MTDNSRRSIEAILARYDLYPWFFVLAPVSRCSFKTSTPYGSWLPFVFPFGLARHHRGGARARAPGVSEWAQAAIFWTLVVLTSPLGQLVVSCRPQAHGPTGDPLSNRFRRLAGLGGAGRRGGRSPSNAPSVVVGLNGASMVALGIPIPLLAFLGGPDGESMGLHPTGGPSAANVAIGPDPEPDIYYIILDAVRSARRPLRVVTGSTASFYETLASRGFTVADRSYTNYAQTSLSLASSLNLAYLDSSHLAASPDNAQLTVAGMIRPA